MKRRYVALGLAALGGCTDPIEVQAPKDGVAQGSAADSQGTQSWKRYLSPEILHAAWAPPSHDTWRAFYKPTLPAAVEIVAKAQGPVGTKPDPKEAWHVSLTNRDLSGAAVFVDLPGEDSVAYSSRLAIACGMVPVCTFNNWPHPKGVVPLDRTLGSLLYWAADVEKARYARGVLPRPVFMLDNRRTSPVRIDKPSEVFDNRYFHVMSDFPPSTILANVGIRTVYYVHPHGQTGTCADDLVDYFVALRGGGVQLYDVAIQGNEGVIAAWTPTSRTTVYGGLASTYAGGSRTYGRSYSSYHHFWSRSRSTWGSGSSGGGGSGYS